MRRRTTVTAALIDNSPDLIYFKDTEGRFIQVNRADAVVLGVERPEQLLGKTSFDFHSKEIATAIHNSELQVIKTGKPIINHIDKLYSPEGELMWLNATKVPIYNSAGDITGLVSLSRDITEQKKMEEQLIREKDLLYNLMDNIPDYIYLKNTELVYTKANVSYARMLGVSDPRKVIGRTEGDFYDEKRAETINKEDRKVLKTGKPVINKLRKFTGENGNRIRLLVNKIPIKEKGTGRIIGVLGVGRDVTLEEEAKVKLKYAKQKAEEANSAKSLFLANMSHEIRTPMNGVIGMSDVLKRTTLTARQEEYVDIIIKSGNNLMSIINDILDFSKIESGKVDIEHVPISIRPVIEDVADVFVVKASEKRVDLITYVDSKIEGYVLGDALRLRQIITNLVNNAIKFTEKGDILISAEQNERSENDVEILFKVRDTGIGISPKEQGKLFKSFSQVDASTTRKYGGTGLGLAISKNLVAMMNGRMGVDSALGEGATFWFTLRFPLCANNQAEEDLKNVDFSNTRILVVDDNKTNLYIFSKYLDVWNCQYTLVQSPIEAIDELKRAGRDQKPYDLALLDFQMNEMDGLMLAEKIKSDPEISRTRLSLLSSVSDMLSKKEIEEKGIDTFLNKPVKLVQLYRLIYKTIFDKEDIYLKRKIILNRGLHNLRVLVADDNEINRKVAQLTLQDIVVVLDLAKNGEEAVEMWKKNSYDLILMDIQMPLKNGYEATLEIRKIEKGKAYKNRVLILAMTANLMKDDLDYCYSIGMDAYLSKPFKVEKLLEILKDFS